MARLDDGFHSGIGDRFFRRLVITPGYSVTFQAAFSDAGSGVASTALTIGTGSSTFTRATTAWTKLSTGLWASVASGSPRFCYFGTNTAATVDGGYLSELAATQLVTPTASIRDMTDASWVKVTMTTAKTATGIDGAANSATTITATGANSTILQTLVAAATSRTYSCWVKRRTGTGTVLLKQGTATLDITALINSSTYTLVQLNDNELNVAYGIQINTNGDALDVDFNQFTSGSEATSPIDTAGATRNADVLTYPAAGNIDPTQGGCYAEIASNVTGSASGNKMYIAISGGGPLEIPTGQASTVIAITDGTTTVTKTGLTSANTAFRKRASSWGGDGLVVTGDGAAVATGAFDGSMGATTLGIGCTPGGSSQANGIIRNARIYSQQISAQGIST